MSETVSILKRVTKPSTILPKLSSVDKVNSPSSTSVDPLPSSIVKMTIIIDSNSSIVETVVSTPTLSVADMDIRVSHLDIEDGSTIEIRIYELQVKITCNIYELISIILSQNDIKISRYRVILVFCGRHLNILNVSDKLSDHGIKQDSVITMFMSGLVADVTSNSLQLKKKRPVYDNSFKDVKSDKKLKTINQI